ncbi:hypothetical protein QF039_002676 [Pseudomonas sp. W2I6]|nr:hypothetical protein [Pseudomonas sp. W2I6]
MTKQRRSFSIAYALDDVSLSRACEAIRTFCASLR